jgi:peptidoglycan-associated lipoprotein
MKKIIISIVLVNLLAACASEKPKETAVAPAAAPAAAAPKTAAAPATTTAVDPLNDPASILAGRSVYFPFDVDAVQEADKALLQAHGQYLGSHSNRMVRVEGNCDERGSNEYNLGLGQRRADNTKKMLELSGAKAGQVSTVSYGEEKPRCTEHNEACWKQNRRADLNYAK